MSIPRDKSQSPHWKEWNDDVWENERNQNGNARSLETHPLHFNHTTHCAKQAQIKIKRRPLYIPQL